MDSILKKKSVGGIHVESDTNICIHHDNLYIFLTASGQIYAFDSQSAHTWKFPKHDQTIQGDLICIALSPTHSHVAAGFSNGSLQLYDMKSKKWLKASPSLLQGPITSLMYINDLTMLASDGSENLYKIQVSVQLWGTSVTKSLFYSVDVPIVRINIPQVYVSGKLIAPVFQNMALISCSGSVKLASCGHEMVCLQNYKTSAHLCAFYVSPPSLIYFCICERNLIRIFTLDDKLVATEIYSHEVDVDPQYLSFLSPQIVVVISKNLTITIVYYTENTLIDEKLPQNSMIIAGSSEFYLVNNGTMNSLSLCTFQDHFETIILTNDFNKIVDLCKRAYEGEPSVSIGLPSNKMQRAVMIERNLGGQFSAYAEERLSAKADPQALAKELIDLSIELGMCRWVIEQAMNLFDNYGFVEALFIQLLNIDKNATNFEYSSQFVERLLQEDINISGKEEFVYKLPNKIAKAETLLKYANRTKNYVLLGDLLKNKINDPQSAINAYLYSQNHDKVCKFLKELIRKGGQNTVLVIRWLCEISDKKTFDHLLFVLKEDTESTNFIINNIVLYIETYQTPFPLFYFVQILIYSLSQMTENPNQSIISIVLDLIIAKRAEVSPENFHFIFRTIFNANSADERREKVLLQLLETDIDENLLESMITLCDALNFHDAKIAIFMKMHRFDRVINVFITEQKTGVFDFLRNQITQDKSAYILDALKKNSMSLVLLDSDKFSSLIFDKYRENVFDIVNSIEDNQIRMTFLRSIVNDEKSNNLKLPDNIVLKFISFLCDNYPSEVLDIIKSIELSPEILEYCTKSSIFDAAAYIEVKMHQLDDALKSLKKYIILTIVEFINGENTSETENRLKFIVDFIIEQCKYRKQEFIDVSGDILRSFAVSLTTDKDDKIFVDAIKTISLHLCNVVTHPVVLQHLMNGYKDIALGKMRGVLNSVISDYEFVLDGSGNMLNIFMDDEERSYREAQNTLGTPLEIGTKCDFCNQPFKNSDVKVFECGHAFHIACCGATCKKCHPTDAPPIEITQKSTNEALQIFEMHISRNGEIEEIAEKGKISIESLDTEILMKTV